MDRAELLRQIQDFNPPRPRSIQADIPLDLETIVLKAMAQQTTDRYQSAGELQEDLQRFLDQRPVRARRAGRMDRLVRWTRRNPVVATLSTIVLVLLLFLGTVSPLVAIRQSRLLHREIQLTQSLNAQQHMLQQQLYVSNINVAANALDVGDIPRATQLLGQYDLDPDRAVSQESDPRGFEWYYLRRRCQMGTPKSSLVASGPGWTQGGSVRSIRFFPNGQHLAAGYWSYNVKVWRLADHKITRTLAAQGRVSWLDVSPDGQLLAATTEDGLVHVWQVAAGKLIQTMETQTRELNRVAFSPNGQYLAFPGNGHSAEIWRRRESAEISFDPVISLPHTEALIGVCFSPDSQSLATGGPSGQITVWDVATGTRRLEIAAHEEEIRDITFSPTGNMLASASADGTAKIWNSMTGRSVHTLHGHTDYVNAVTFSPDGKRLSTSSWDGSFRLWDVASGQQQSLCRLHSSPVWSTAFSSDGATIATAGWDAVVKLWDVDHLMQETDSSKRLEIDTNLFGLSFCPTTHQVAASARDGTVYLWDDLNERSRPATTLHNAGMAYRVQFSPDGKCVAAAGGEWSKELEHRLGYGTRSDEPQSAFGELKLWDVATGKLAHNPDGHTDLVFGIAFVPNGTQLFSSSADGTVRLWNVATGELVEMLPRTPSQVFCLSVSPDGQSLAVGTDENLIEVWQYADSCWTLKQILRGHTDWVWAVTFSPDGRRLASGSLDRTARLWNLADGSTEFVMPSHHAWVLSLDFTPDGRTLATGSSDRRIVLWNTATGQQLLTLTGHDSWVHDLTFSPDGRTLLSGSADGTLLEWCAGP